MANIAILPLKRYAWLDRFEGDGEHFVPAAWDGRIGKGECVESKRPMEEKEKREIDREM